MGEIRKLEREGLRMSLSIRLAIISVVIVCACLGTAATSYAQGPSAASVTVQQVCTQGDQAACSAAVRDLVLSIVGNSCAQDDQAGCKAAVQDLTSRCKVNWGGLEQQPCAPALECFQDLMLTQQALNACQAQAGGDATKCDAQQKRITLARSKGCHNEPAFKAVFIPYGVTWRRHAPGDTVHGDIIRGGEDYDQNMAPLYVCAVIVQKTDTGEILGIRPGKILNGNCNAAINGVGTEFHEFIYPVLLNAQGYWGPPQADLSHALQIGLNWGGKIFANEIVCSVNYTTHSSVFLGMGSQDNDHGRHIGRLAQGCTFEWGGQEVHSDSGVEVYYLAPKPQPPAPPPHPNPPNPAVPLAIQSCGITPSSIHLGDTAQLWMQLNKPVVSAATVVVDINANGSADTFRDGILVSAQIPASSPRMSYQLRTKSVLNPASQASFVLKLAGVGQCVANLTIN